MKLYPWLINHYKKIINSYQIKKGHYAFILESKKGIGVNILAQTIGSWLLCLHKTGHVNCKSCHSCRLFKNKSHPDWYDLNLITKNSIGIDAIRMLRNKIFNSAQQGNNKIVYLSKSHTLTDAGINGLLKTIEDPPENTYFLFVSYISKKKIPSTLRSRCILYRLNIPSEKYSTMWLKKNNSKIKKNIYLLSLRINQGSIFLAKKFIHSSLWDIRTHFFNSLLNAIHSRNLLNLLENFVQNFSEQKIIWIHTILFDAIKWKNDNSTNVINLDQINIIQLLANAYSFHSLDESYVSWIYCYDKLINISGINSELLFINQLLKWEKLLKLSTYI